MLIALFAMAAWSAAQSPARAQHGTSGYGVVPMDPHDSALLEVQTAEFELPGRSGVWQTVAPRLEYAPVPWLSIAARPTLARIDYADGESVVGLGDGELTVKALALRVARLHLTVSTGVSGEVPLGDPDTGTGNGHVSLFPFVTFMSMPSRTLMLHAMIGDRVVLGGGQHDDPHAHHAGHAGHPGHTAAPHGSVLMPHSEHELAGHAGVCVTLGWFVIAPSLELMQVLSPGSDTFLNGQLELALVPRRELRLAAAFDLPLLEDRRYEWRSRLMAALLY